MKFSYEWMREFVDDLDVPAQALERLITMKTAECEGIETVGELLAGAVAARVETVQDIPGSHNRKAVVSTIEYGRKTVVCGAKNCREGILTAYVPLGTKSISGVESDGMLASSSELGINKDHSGILEILDEDDLPTVDSVIEIDNKSITHRPDLWGHYGMAREVAAITGKRLRNLMPMSLLPALGGDVDVAIDDFSLCPRYSALAFENVTVQRSPLWLQFRLTSIGLNPINNIVDLTNFIMAELAQPMHAFDRQKLHGTRIWARRAAEGEKLVALNDEEYLLNSGNLVIADAAGPIALAGIIGGKYSAISDATTSIVLESANFNASNIRKTSSALKLRTDASMRFEKAQDPWNTVRALARALELLPLLSPGIRLVGGLADCASATHEAVPISLDLHWLSRKLGRVMEAGDVRRILESLQFGVTQPQSGTLSVSVPSWRATKDVALPDDLVEEVGRMIGYDTIPPAPPLVPCSPSFDPPERLYLRSIRRSMAARGFTEVSNYSFISEAEATRFGFAREDHFQVKNPIAEGQELMRTSLLPGLYRNVVENAKQFDSFRIFEIGREIHKGEAGKPVERPHLMAALFARDDGRAGLLEMKGAAECLAPGVHVRGAVELSSWQHTTRTAELWWQGRRIGWFCELHPSLVDGGRAAVMDVDLLLLQELEPGLSKYQSVRRFPTSTFDLSIFANEREPAANLELQIRRFAGELAERVEYVREYQGAQVPQGRKSVSFRVVVGAADRTLSADEITGIRSRIIRGLQENGYDLRV